MFTTIQTTATEQSYIDIILVTDNDIILNLTGTPQTNGVDLTVSVSADIVKVGIPS